MSDTMNAMRLHKYGAPDVMTLEQVARPEPGSGEVLVRVMAAGINPIDCVTRAGNYARIWPDDPFPAIVGWDISGVVEAVGAGVTAFKPGDAVFGMPRFPEMVAAYAEYVVAPADGLAAKPASIDHVTAASVPLAALTAWQALYEAGGLTKGQTTLIHAAAGGVGHFAVQLAKWTGATVIATASGRNEAFVNGLGADRFIDYTATDVGQAVEEIDMQLDSLGGAPRERLWGVMKKGGVLVSIKGPIAADEIIPEDIRAESIRVHPSADQLTQIGGLIDAGTVRVEVDTVYELADAAKAHAHVEGGHSRGKVVLHVAD